MHKDLIDRSDGFFIQIPHRLVLGIKNGNALLVYAILKTYSNNGSLVFPSRETVAEHMGAKSTRTVDSALKNLAELGLVATFPRWRNSEGKTSRRPDDEFKFQTSNGYILYDKIRSNPPAGWDDPGCKKLLPPLAESCEGGVQDSAHEQEPVEQEPVEQYPPIVPQGDDHDPFDEWWEHYPKKVGKGQARTAFKRALKKVDLDTLTEGTRQLAAHHQQAGTDKTFIPNPATWLNGERWDDEQPAINGERTVSVEDVLSWRVSDSFDDEKQEVPF